MDEQEIRMLGLVCKLKMLHVSLNDEMVRLVNHMSLASVENLCQEGTKHVLKKTGLMLSNLYSQICECVQELSSFR